MTTNIKPGHEFSLSEQQWGNTSLPVLGFRGPQDEEPNLHICHCCIHPVMRASFHDGSRFGSAARVCSNTYEKHATNIRYSTSMSNMRVIVFIILVWPTSLDTSPWLFICVFADMSPYCSAHDEWLIMKLCMFVGYHTANIVSNFGGDPVTQLNFKKC